MLQVVKINNPNPQFKLMIRMRIISGTKKLVGFGLPSLKIIILFKIFRIDIVMSKMLGEGLVWVDAKATEKTYWVPSIFTSQFGG